MYNYIPSEKELFEDIHSQRFVEIQKGIKVQFKQTLFQIISPKYQISDEQKRLSQLLEKKMCLGIYTLQGNLVTKVQPFQLKINQDNKNLFVILSTSAQDVFRNNLKYRWKQFYITIYRNASDYGYKHVLSSNLEYFTELPYYKSQKILSYIKGQKSQLEVDKILHFQPHRNLKNQEQIAAINQSGRHMSLIIEGPAGVGKSLVGCKIGVQFCLKQKKTIMVTVTNTGAKSICEHLVQQLVLNKIGCHQQNSKFLRLLKAITKVKSQITFQNVQGTLIDVLDKQIKQRIKRMDKQPPKINFLYFNLLVTLQQYFCMQPYLRFYSFNTHIIVNLVKLTNYEMPVLDILLNLNKIANKITVIDTFKELYLKSVRLTIKNATMVVTNTAKAAEINRYQQKQQDFNPYIAIFDEAAQSTLADTYCILSLDIKRIILIGDQKQLPPVMMGNHDSLKFTLFNIMKNKNKRNFIKFTYQYRMHPEIAKLVSYLTYGGQIINGFKKNKRISQIKGYFQYPVFMVTHDSQQQMPTSIHQNGYFNIQEIKMIKLYIDQFPDDYLKNIGIVTVYKAQERRMKEVFQTQVKLGLSISTVDGYQGAEKDYIFFSVVRSNSHGKLGFSQDKNRVNVALSRAKVGLVLIGSIHTLKYGNYDNPWKFVIEYLWKIDSIFHFPEDLLVRAEQNYLIRKVRDKSKELDVQQAFDIHDDDTGDNEDQKAIIEKQVFYFETQELPFIASNYN